MRTYTKSTPKMLPSQLPPLARTSSKHPQKAREIKSITCKDRHNELIFDVKEEDEQYGDGRTEFKQQRLDLFSINVDRA